MKLRRANEIPWVLFATTLLVVGAHSSPALALALEDRATLSARPGGFAEFWRLVTGHLTHGTTRHAILNLALLIPLIGWREHRVGSRQVLAEFLLIALAVAIGVRLLHDGWTSYRGLSGVVYGFLAIWLLDRARDPEHGTVAMAVLVTLTLKTLLECSTGGWAWNADDLTSSLGVRYLPGSHLAGLLCGIALATERNEPDLPPLATENLHRVLTGSGREDARSTSPDKSALASPDDRP